MERVATCVVRYGKHKRKGRFGRQAASWGLAIHRLMSLGHLYFCYAATAAAKNITPGARCTRVCDVRRPAVALYPS
jgi:hypothetical protein